MLDDPKIVPKFFDLVFHYQLLKPFEDYFFKFLSPIWALVQASNEIDRIDYLYSYLSNHLLQQFVDLQTLLQILYHLKQKLYLLTVFYFLTKHNPILQMILFVRFLTCSANESGTALFSCAKISDLYLLGWQCSISLAGAYFDIIVIVFLEVELIAIHHWYSWYFRVLVIFGFGLLAFYIFYIVAHDQCLACWHKPTDGLFAHFLELFAGVNQLIGLEYPAITNGMSLTIFLTFFVDLVSLKIDIIKELSDPINEVFAIVQ